MAERPESSTSNFEMIRHAVEQRDLDSIVGLYADDAELMIVDRNHPPRAPLELRGKAEIRGYLQEIFARNMTHHVEREVVTPNRIAFEESCTYPDGTHVLSTQMLELQGDGKIARQRNVVVWDE
jgi:ketosteroid isomerase-like protein